MKKIIWAVIAIVLVSQISVFAARCGYGEKTWNESPEGAVTGVPYETERLR